MKEFFYVITESMLDLGLRGTELNLFANIYGYSQKGDGCCYATRRELARRCGVSSTNTIDAAMQSLIEKGLVIKSTMHRDGQDLVAYSYNAKFAQGTQNLSRGYSKIEQGGYAKFAHMENKEKENKNIFIPPTPQEVLEYAKERGFVDPSGFAAHFCEYYTISSWHLSNGRPMNDWKKAVITWEPNNKYRNFGKPSPRSATPPSHNTSPDNYDFSKDW